MLSGNSTRALALGVGLCALLGVWLYPTDDKRVKEVAETLVSAANGSPAQLRAALAENAISEVSIDVAELSDPLNGRDAIVDAVGKANALGAKLHFRIEAVEVSLEGKRARVTADLITMLQPELPELRRPRHSVALFEKRSGRFQLVSAEIGPERRDQPEARP